MKRGCYVWAGVLGLSLIAFRAQADPTDPSDDSSSDSNYLRYDADGVPLSVTQSHGPKLSADEINAVKKQQDREDQDKNWLLRGYEQQLHSHADSNSADDQGANLYFELTSNKELARLAGLQPWDSGASESLTYRTGASVSQRTAPLRADASRTTGMSSQRNLFRPLITPLSAADAAGLHNFYSPIAPSTVAPFYANAASSNPAPTPSRDTRVETEDPADIETPGMVAAERDPLADPSTSDLTLDVLPEESIDHARAHQDNYNDVDQLPAPMDAAQLHKEQSASLQVPGASNPAKAASANAVPPKATPVTEDPEAPMPVSTVPQITPVRAPIANPFDILNR
jgi:hypothetical protein